MGLRNLTTVSEDEKTKVLNRFLMAHEDQLFPQEVVALYLNCSPWTLAKMRTEDGAEVIWAKAKIDFDAITQSLKEVS